jgi:N-acetylglutamate synthase-like GNAT family acetyltransferase
MKKKLKQKKLFFFEKHGFNRVPKHTLRQCLSKKLRLRFA